MFLFINSTIINPAFSSQTKEKLITDIKNFGTEIKLTDKFINSIYKSEITNSITDWLDQKKVADEKKAEREANKAIAKVKVDKLIDCKWAGTDKKDKCRLILTEGDSAMSAYRANRDPNVDAGLPLRGKSLNVRDLPKSKLGVDIENGFEPEYINIRGKGDLIKALKADAKARTATMHKVINFFIIKVILSILFFHTYDT